jgi:glucose dehydrogenase
LATLTSWLVAAVVGIAGVVLTAGGAVLITHGGSPYYLITGLGLLVCSVGLIRRTRIAPWCYAAVLTLTIVWSLWEVGLDSWALMPRLLAMALIGLLFLLPSIRSATRSSRWIVAVPAIAALAIIGVAVVRAQTAESGLPSAARVVVALGAPTDWRHWGNNLAGTRYAAIDQINLGNVGSLKQVWRYDSDIEAGALRSLEAPPLAVDGRLYMCIESGTVDALDQDTGKRLWRYRALPENSPYLGWKCRGVAYYAAKSQQPDCQRRLFLTTSAGQLIAIDADTGLPCSRFANAGIADLKDGMGVM